MSNEIRINVTAKDSSNLDAIGKKAGKDLADGVGRGADQAAKSVDTATKRIKSDVDKAGSSARSAGKAIASGIDSGADQAAKSVDTAAKKIASDLDRIEQEAWQSGKGMDKAFTSAVAGMRSKLKQLQADAARTGKGLESDLGDALRDVRKQADQLGHAGKKAGSALGSGLSEGLSEGLSSFGGAGGSLAGGLVGSISAGKAGMVGAGLLLGGALLDGFESMWQQNKIGAIVATQTGQASSAAGKMGSIAGDVFADNFGESIDDVGAAMTSVFQNHLIDTSAPESAIKSLTEKVITVGDTMGEEANRVSRAAHQMIVTGVAGSVDEALDLIQRGTQNGLNTADDFLDTITEYSTNFRTLGLDGQEAFGLLGQAAQGGARDTDMAADALKEFSIRVLDGSATTARGFKTIGLDADDMAARFAAGGDTAKQALRETLNALQLMPPGVERSTAAVDLFGTKAEDLGEALFHMDLDNAANKFGDFEGSVAKTAAAISAATPATEKFGRGFDRAKEQAAEAAVAFVDWGSGVDETNQKFVELAQAQEAFMKGDTSKLDDLKEKYPELSGAIDQFIEKNHGEAEASKNAADAVTEHVDTLQELISAQQEAAGVVLNERDAMREYRSSVKDATEAVDTHKQVSDDEAEKLDAVAKSALDAADSMVKNGRDTNEVNKVVNTARTRFIALAQRMGYSKIEAINLANSLKLIPRRVDASVVVHTEAARANIAAYQRALNNIPRNITTNVQVRGANINATAYAGHQFYEHGGITSRAQTGGARNGSTLINEAGPEAVDLPNGSRVMTAGATRAMAERGLLGDVGILETAATGGARGRGVPAYQRTGQVNISEGRHSPQFIRSLLSQGWRAMDGNYSVLYSPARQASAGDRRHFSSGDVAASGHNSGVLVGGGDRQPFAGGLGGHLQVSADADSAVGALINKLIRDNKIKLVRRS